MILRSPRTLNAAGQCCGRKPLVYKRDRHLFCCRCDASFDFDGHQKANWAWKAVEGGFIPTYPESEAALRIPPDVGNAPR